MIKGSKHSEETRRKMSTTHKNKPNFGVFKKGHTTWNKGITGEESHSFGQFFSEERKKRISEAKKKYKFTERHLLNMSLCMRREKHPNWKGGITELRKAIMDSKKHREWKKEILLRDRNQCRICGEREK